jgi:hypothetical protein
VTSSVFFSSDEGTEPEHNTQRWHYEIAEKLHITLKVKHWVSSSKTKYNKNEWGDTKCHKVSHYHHHHEKQ